MVILNRGAARWLQAVEGDLTSLMEDADLVTVDQDLDHLATQARGNRVTRRAEADGREVIHLAALPAGNRRPLDQWPQQRPLLLQPVGRHRPGLLVHLCVDLLTPDLGLPVGLVEGAEALLGDQPRLHVADDRLDLPLRLGVGGRGGDRCEA
ncbi:MAG: hypothetical protein M3170_03765, partial [Candidatus Dormibacteraeota bacterium]|nr:hypothetical protein [Candidatus Dormibacteraeota bacterium]